MWLICWERESRELEAYTDSGTQLLNEVLEVMLFP